jgi:23S rRNA pseudouridine1911/1915/1917 synthase
MSTVLDELKSRFPTAKLQTLRRMIGNRRVLIGGVPARSAKQVVAEGQKFEIVDEPRQRSRQTQHQGEIVQKLPLRVVFEDDDVLVIDKPPGLLSSSVPREKRATALGILRHHVALPLDGRIGLVHRLDRDAAGLLLFSKNDAAHRSLKRQFRDHAVHRVYTAAVTAAPPHKAARITSRLVELPDGSVRSTQAPGKGQLAITHYEVLGRRGSLVILRLTLHTGRKHQIRAQLSELGTPIAGDAIYRPRGGKRTGKQPGPQRLMLVASELAFDHPRDGRRVELKLPLPKDMTPE